MSKIKQELGGWLLATLIALPFVIGLKIIVSIIKMVFWPFRD